MTDSKNAALESQGMDYGPVIDLKPHKNWIFYSGPRYVRWSIAVDPARWPDDMASIEFSDPAIAWHEAHDALNLRLAERLAAATEQSRKTAPTAATCSGLTASAFDGERLGRLGWVPGAHE